MTGTDREKDFDMLYHFEFETIPKLFRKFGRKYINILEQPAELYRQFNSIVRLRNTQILIHGIHFPMRFCKTTMIS